MRIRWQVWLICLAPLAVVLGLFWLHKHRSAGSDAGPPPSVEEVSVAAPAAPGSEQPGRWHARTPRVAATPPEEWLRLALVATNEENRAEALAHIEAAEIPKMLAMLTDEQLKGEVGTLLLKRWMAADASAAAAWVVARPRGKCRDTLLERVGEEWAQRDYQATHAWVMSLERSDDQLQVWTSLDYERNGRVAVSANPVIATEVDQRLTASAASACEWVATLPAGSNRMAAVEFLAGRLADQSARTALDWIHTLPDESERMRAYIAVLPKLPIKCDPAAQPPR